MKKRNGYGSRGSSVVGVAFGILLILLGVAVGLYLGVWWAFIGGIASLIHLAATGDWNALWIAESIARVFFAGLIGWASALVLIFPGWALLSQN